ncbi:MAG: YraN family protein, partial [Alcaligenaceae bacterium]|nr:YraN family protein [Alcaligenaceae bacterium]
MGSDPFEIAQRAQKLAAQRRARRLRTKPQAKRNSPGDGSPRQRQGYAAEARAGRYLVEQGLQILARNLRCKAGEIDLAARDAQTLVFVEV